MKKAILTILSTLAISGFAYCQDINFTTPVRLGENVNSKYTESNPILSCDGKTLYFVRTDDPRNSDGEEGDQDVWYSTLVNDQWAAPSNDLRMVNNGDNNAVVGVGKDGNKLFLINTYSAHPRRGHAVAYSIATNGSWEAPSELDLVLKLKSDLYGFYMTPEEDILLISMKSDRAIGEEDLYVSLKKDDKWIDPIHLGDVINTEGFEISPFLSEGGDSLFFASNGHGGLGSADIFVSKRLSDDWKQWSAPVNLGGQVNSKAFDAYYFRRGNIAYFSSAREGGSDIYQVSFKEKEDGQQEVKDEEPLAKEEEITSSDDPTKKNDPEEGPTARVEEKATAELTYQTHRVYFDFDDHQLDADAKEAVRDIVTTIKEHDVSGIKIVVTGHADNMGPEIYNRELSRKRAEEVAAYLKQLGMPQSHVQTAAKGENLPLNGNDTPEGRAENRRVEIIFEEGE